jgi:hypothetical protein
MWLMRTEDLIGCGQAAGNGCAIAGAGRRAFASGAIPPLLRAWGAARTCGISGRPGSTERMLKP